MCEICTHSFKHFYEASFSDEEDKWTKGIRPGFEKFVSQENEMFYQQKLKSLKGKSIAHFTFVDGGDEMLGLREQLLSLMVKIDRKIYHDDSRKDAGQKRVIAKLKTKIPTSRNLSQCIESVDTRFRWGPFKKIGYILKSFMCNIVLGYTFYGLDVGTDVKYSLDMFSINATDICHENFQKISSKTSSDTVLGSKSCLEDSVYFQQGLIAIDNLNPNSSESSAHLRAHSKADAIILQETKAKPGFFIIYINKIDLQLFL